VERRDEFYVNADLPGVDQDHVRIHLEEGVLSIDAELTEALDPSWTPIYAEYRLGGYHREFRVSDAIDVDRIQATMRDGVLQLHLPKTDKHRPRQIEVRGE
jgi:HSP20 family molecular chaperone IbpA